MVRIIFKKNSPVKSNNKSFPKIKKSTFAVSLAVWDYLPQGFRFCKTYELLKRCVNFRIFVGCILQLL